MGNVKRVYVEKKAPFAVKAKELQEEIGNYLDIKSVTGVRIFIRYDVENLSDTVFEQALSCVFSEPPVDDYYLETIEIPAGNRVFSVSFFRDSSTRERILPYNVSVSSRRMRNL